MSEEIKAGVMELKLSEKIENMRCETHENELQDIFEEAECLESFHEVAKARIVELERQYAKTILCLDRIQNMCIGDVAMGIGIDSGEIGELVWDATGKISPNELSVMARELINAQI